MDRKISGLVKPYRRIRSGLAKQVTSMIAPYCGRFDTFEEPRYSRLKEADYPPYTSASN